MNLNPGIAYTLNVVAVDRKGYQSPVTGVLHLERHRLRHDLLLVAAGSAAPAAGHLPRWTRGSLQTRPRHPRGGRQGPAMAPWRGPWPGNGEGTVAAGLADGCDGTCQSLLRSAGHGEAGGGRS